MNPVGRKLSYGEQKNLEAKIQELEDAQGGKELVQGVNMSSPNIQKNRREIQRLRSILATRGVGEVSAKEKSDAEKEEAILREKLQKGMPSWDRYQQSRPKDGPRHDKIVNWIVEADADVNRRQMIDRWKTLRRIINPHDPKAAHVNNLFPE